MIGDCLNGLASDSRRGGGAGETAVLTPAKQCAKFVYGSTMRYASANDAYDSWRPAAYTFAMLARIEDSSADRGFFNLGNSTAAAARVVTFLAGTTATTINHSACNGTTITQVVSGVGNWQDWHLYVGGWDGARLYLQIDELRVAPVAYTGALNTATGLPLIVGYLGNGRPFDGRIGWLGLWPTFLSEGEVSTMPRNGLMDFANALRSQMSNYYEFDGSPIIADQIGSITLTQTNSPQPGQADY